VHPAKNIFYNNKHRADCILIGLTGCTMDDIINKEKYYDSRTDSGKW